MIEQAFRAYFDAFTGSASWEELEPHFEAVFHDDLVVKTANGELDRAGWKSAVQALLASGAKGKVDSLRRDGDKIIYAATLTKADGTEMRPLSKGTIQDGKVIRVEPMNPIEYTNISGSSAGY